ncbi:MAG: hypothetical protein GXP63_03610 [DPANN group archaeon]|nr:hypothetical protein [DPANN group archaeon]
MPFIDIFVDYALLVAFVALTADIFLQIRKIFRRKSSLDVSARGLVVRMVGALILLAKFIIIDDTVLMVGQTVFVLAFMAYFLLVLYFRFYKKKE